MRPIAVLLIFFAVALPTIGFSAETTMQPLECKVAPNVGPNVLLCIERLDRPLALKDILAIAASGFAVLLSLISLFYSHQKDIKARRQSINDDFWIRKIISPIAIEPLIKDITEIISRLPADCKSYQWSLDSFRPYAEDFTVKKQLLTTALFAFSLLDKKLYKSAIQHLDNIEDILVEYCGSNAGKARTTAGQPKYQKSITQSSVMEELLALLEDVKNFQFDKI